VPRPPEESEELHNFYTEAAKNLVEGRYSENHDEETGKTKKKKKSQSTPEC
jgi:hypothetical protein